MSEYKIKTNLAEFEELVNQLQDYIDKAKLIVEKMNQFEFGYEFDPELEEK